MARRRIVIEDAGLPAEPEAPAADRSVDLQDILLASGILFLEAAASVIWWPAALILAGLFCLGFAFLIERDRAKRKNGNPNQ